MIPADSPWLLLLLRPRLAYALVAGDLGPEFTVDGIRYMDIADGTFNWFSDRLVNTVGRWIGIELNPLAPILEDLPHHVRDLPYLTVATFSERVAYGPEQEDIADRIVQIQIFFTGVAVADAVTTGEQAFDGRVYADPNGQFALSFNTLNFLGISDLDSLAGSGIERITLT